MGYQYPLTNNQPLSNCQILVVLISSKNCLDLKKKIMKTCCLYTEFEIKYHIQSIILDSACKNG